MMALVASLWEELPSLRTHVASQEHSASHNDGDEAEDEDKHLAVGCRLHSFRRYVSDLLLDYVPQPDPSGHAPCSIVQASLDCYFEEEYCSHTIDLHVESALPLSPLLLGMQASLDRYLQDHCEEVPVSDLSESLAAGIGRTISAQHADEGLGPDSDLDSHMVAKSVMVPRPS